MEDAGWRPPPAATVPNGMEAIENVPELIEKRGVIEIRQP
jgi:hypothetical protein